MGMMGVGGRGCERRGEGDCVAGRQQVAGNIFSFRWIGNTVGYEVEAYTYLCGSTDGACAAGIKR